MRPIAVAGEGAEEIVSTEVLWSASERGSGPTGTAIRTRVPCVMDLLASSPRASPWLSTTLRHHLVGALSLPIVIDGELFGAVTIFAREAGAFDADEIGLLVGIVRGAAQAIAKIRARAAQRRSEAALVETERRFKLIFDSTESFMALVSPDGTIQELNGTTLKRAGLTAGEAIGRKLWELPVHASGDELADAIAKVGRERVGVRLDLPVKLPGGPRRIDARLVPLHDEETHEVTAILAEAHDVTARHDAEERLQRSERRFRRMLDGGWDVVTLQDPTGRCTYVSGSSERVLGRSPDEIARMAPGEAIHPDDTVTAQAAFQATVSTPGASRTFEVRFRHGRGGWLWLQSLCANLVDDPDVGGILTITRDITARKETELALAASERELRQIADHVRDVLWIVDPAKARVVYVSPAYASVFGRLPPSYEARPRAWFAAVVRDDVEGIRRAFEACVAGHRVEMAARVRRRDGSLRHLRATASPVYDAAGAVTRIVGVARDATEDRGVDAAPTTVRRRAR